jgi:hypothetical protein
MEAWAALKARRDPSVVKKKGFQACSKRAVEADEGPPYWHHPSTTGRQSQKRSGGVEQLPLSAPKCQMRQASWLGQPHQPTKATRKLSNEFTLKQTGLVRLYVSSWVGFSYISLLRILGGTAPIHVQLCFQQT